MKVYGDEFEMPIDVWSMVVWIWSNAHRCSIYGGESQMPIDVWSMMVKIDQGP